MKVLFINLVKLLSLFISIIVLSSITLEESNKLLLSSDCNNAPFYYVSVKNQGYWIQMPTICDEHGYIFQGEPSLGALFDGDELTRRQILEQVYAKSLTPGGTDSPSFN